MYSVLVENRRGIVIQFLKPERSSHSLWTNNTLPLRFMLRSIRDQPISNHIGKVRKVLLEEVAVNGSWSLPHGPRPMSIRRSAGSGLT